MPFLDLAVRPSRKTAAGVAHLKRKSDHITIKSRPCRSNDAILIRANQIAEFRRTKLNASPRAFMSYARTDDDHVKGHLSDFRTELYVQVRLLSGCKGFTIFQDKFSISPGQNWQERVCEEVDSACVFIAIMTPAFFRSEACREEVERFHKRVSGSQNPYLLLPIYYVASPQLEDPGRRDKDRGLSETQFKEIESNRRAEGIEERV